MSNLSKTIFSLLGVSLISACSNNYHPVPQHMSIETNSSISVTAGISQTMVRSKDASYLLCTQPMADAAYDQGSGSNFSIGLVNTSSDQISDQSDSNEVEMAGRTPAVLIAREMFFRACEFSGNYGLTKDEALKLYQQTLVIIGGVWSTEAANTKVTIGDSVQSNNASTLQGSSTNSISSSDTASSNVTKLAAGLKATSDDSDDSDE
jgi:hypothetical protein